MDLLDGFGRNPLEPIYAEEPERSYASQARAEELWVQDHVFPNVLDAVRAALSGSRALSV